jgi:hypothetical protein
MVAAALLLVVSLFLVWSHQLSGSVIARYGSTGAFTGVPRAPDAWQVYSTADVLLALLALVLLVSALFGSRAARVVVLIATAIALAFTLHALSTPPTNGANIFNPALSVPNYEPSGATSGAGETIAAISLVVALAGLMVSFTAD